MMLTATVTGPEAPVRWRAAVDPDARNALEERHRLRNGRQDHLRQLQDWRDGLDNSSPRAVEALLRSEGAADTPMAL